MPQKRRAPFQPYAAKMLALRLEGMSATAVAERFGCGLGTVRRYGRIGVYSKRTPGVELEQILPLLKAGLSRQRIAFILGTSRATVRRRLNEERPAITG